METMKDIRAHFASAKEGEYNALLQRREKPTGKICVICTVKMKEAVYRN